MKLLMEILTSSHLQKEKSEERQNSIYTPGTVRQQVAHIELPVQERPLDTVTTTYSRPKTSRMQVGLARVRNVFST